MELASGGYRQHHILCLQSHTLDRMVLLTLHGKMEHTPMIFHLLLKLPQILRKLLLVVENNGSPTIPQLYLTSMEQLLSLKIASSLDILSLLKRSLSLLPLE